MSQTTTNMAFPPFLVFEANWLYINVPKIAKNTCFTFFLFEKKHVQPIITLFYVLCLKFSTNQKRDHLLEGFGAVRVPPVK
jgi:hypothetical protein